MINYEYIIKILKNKGYKLSEVAESIGVQYQTLYKSLKTSNSYETLNRIAEATKINFIEFLVPPVGYDHFYDTITGEWLGIRKK